MRAAAEFYGGYGYQCSFRKYAGYAIESVVKIKDCQKRLISLHVIQDKQFIRIRTENYCEENVQFQDGIPITTKKDKRFHGYGMKSMKKNCREVWRFRYGGQGE